MTGVFRRVSCLLTPLAVATLAGCGGGNAAAPAPTGPASTGSSSAAPAPARAPVAKLDRQLVAGLGDSITAGSPLWDPDPTFRTQIAAGRPSDPRSQWGYWYQRSHPGVKVRNCGVFGERTDQIAARQEECERGAATLVVQGGINDIAQGRPVADAARSLEAMVVRGKADGRAVALVEVLPWNNGYPQAVAPIVELNGLIDAIGRRQDVPVFPWYAALEDPRHKARMRAAETIDGDHPSITGYRRLAALVKLPSVSG